MDFEVGLTAQDLLQMPDPIDPAAADAEHHVTLLELSLAKGADLRIERLGRWEERSGKRHFAVTGRG